MSDPIDPIDQLETFVQRGRAAQRAVDRAIADAATVYREPWPGVTAPATAEALHEMIVWIPDRSWWPCAGRKCRGGRPGSCPRPSVASFPRGRTGRRWAYCDEHLYGRVWDPVLGVLIGVAGDSPAAGRGYVE